MLQPVVVWGGEQTQDNAQQKWLLRAAVAKQLVSTKGQTWICKRPG